MADIFVDPSINADSGTGSLVDPFGDLQYALDQSTLASGGDVFHVKQGTEEVLSARLDISLYGTPSVSNPWTIKGYSAAANDGGLFTINCNGNTLLPSGVDSANLADGKVHNGPASGVMCAFDFNATAINVEFTDGDTLVRTRGLLLGCHFHDGNEAIRLNDAAQVLNCYFKNDGTKSFTTAIETNNGDNTLIQNNIFSLSGSSKAIRVAADNVLIAGNSILSSGGTGRGIEVRNFSQSPYSIYNNVIEGFSGAGGIGITIGSNPIIAVYGKNALYNNTTNYSVGGNVLTNLGDNEVLGSSPFAKSGSDTFANRFVYFSPADVGNLRGGAYAGS